MEYDVMTIECVQRGDGEIVARITTPGGDVRDLLPGQKIKLSVKTEGSGGGPGSTE